MIAMVQPDQIIYASDINPAIASAIEAQAHVCGEGISRDFWLCTDGSGAPRGRICRSGASLWACADDLSALPELADFIGRVGYDSLLTDTDTAMVLGGDEEDSLPVMTARVVIWPKSVQGTVRVSGPGDPSWVKALADIHRRAGLLSSTQEMDGLFSELHLRSRRGAAAGVLLFDDRNELSACAAISALGSRYALIGYVCTLQEKRGRGYASAVTGEMARLALELGRIPVLSCRGELTPLYKRLGFRANGEGVVSFSAGEALL